MAVGMPGVDDKKVKLSGGDAAKGTARNRAMADAPEIKLLLDDSGDDSIKKLQRDIKATAMELKKSGMSPEKLTAAIQVLASKADEETSLRAKE
jgi:hypothetical protein